MPAELKPPSTQHILTSAMSEYLADPDEGTSGSVAILLGGSVRVAVTYSPCAALPDGLGRIGL